MKPPLKRVWRFARWPLGVLLVLYVGFVLYRIPAVGEKKRTAEAVAHIHAQKITLDDVMGAHLPPTPNEEENNATLAGVDANKNGIRDDVELAIFKKYPDSPRIRAAELQYALTQQMFLTRVFNIETWKAVAEENSRSFNCISEVFPRDNLSVYIEITNGYTKEVETFVYNSKLRVNAKEKIYNFITSYGDASGNVCDVDLNTLPK